MNASCRADVVDAVVEICGTDPADLDDGADLERLGIDSLDLIEIGMIMEERHDIALDGADFDGVTTFGGAVEVFDRKIAGTRRADPGS